MKRKSSPKQGGIEPKTLMAYDHWVAKNLDEMSRKYPHKVIAVYGGKLVAVGDSFKEVYAAARAQGIKEAPFAMEVPTAEDVEAILYAPVGFSAKLGVPFNLLGRQGIFEHFTICFHERRKAVSFKRLA